MPGTKRCRKRCRKLWKLTWLSDLTVSSSDVGNQNFLSLILSFSKILLLRELHYERDINWLSRGSTSHLTQNRSFRRHSFPPISWLGTEETKPKASNTGIKRWKLTQKILKILNLKKHTHKWNLNLNQRENVSTVTCVCMLCVHIIVHNCRTQYTISFSAPTIRF